MPQGAATMSHREGNEVIVWLTIFFICVAGLATEASQSPSHDLENRHKRQSDRKNQKKDPLDLPGIWCYQCVDLNSNQSFCALGHELVKTQVTVREKVAQDLNAISGYGFQQCGLWYPYCVIEEHYFGEKNTSATYTRDCANTQRKFENMNITLDNKTRCTWNVELKGQVCLTYCMGDFCNGPQYVPPDDVSSCATRLKVWWSWLIGYMVGWLVM